MASKSNSRPPGAARLFHQPNEKARFAAEPRQDCASVSGLTTGFPAREHEFADLRPLPRGQDKAGSEERIAGAIVEVTLRAEMQPAQDTALEVFGRRFVAQLVLQDLVENLERRRPVDKRLARFGHHRRRNAVSSRSP